MQHLVLTVVGDDRPGLVTALADVVASHGGNWERSEFSELAGAFAGIVLVTVPADRASALTSAMQAMEGMLSVTVHSGVARVSDTEVDTITVSVLGNDRPGIVHELSQAIAARGASIESFTSRTREAPMAGGTLFDATIIVRPDAHATAGDIADALERVAADLQVDLTVA